MNLKIDRRKIFFISYIWWPMKAFWRVWLSWERKMNPSYQVMMSNKKSISEIYKVTKAWNGLVCDIKTRTRKWKSVGGELGEKRALCTMTGALGTCHKNAVMMEVYSFGLDGQKITHPLWSTRWRWAMMETTLPIHHWAMCMDLDKGWKDCKLVKFRGLLKHVCGVWWVWEFGNWLRKVENSEMAALYKIYWVVLGYDCLKEEVPHHRPYIHNHLANQKQGSARKFPVMDKRSLHVLWFICKQGG